jgi:hypothetical protein
MNKPSRASHRRTKPEPHEEAPLDRAAWLGHLTEGLVVASWRLAPGVLILALLITVSFSWYSANHLGMDTKTTNLIDPELPWRKEEVAFNSAFPQDKNVLIAVAEGATPEIADKAAQDLSAALKPKTDLFPSVSYLDGLPFFRRNGLLFLSTDQLQSVTDELVSAQGLLGMLAEDPSLNGLFSSLNLALDGVDNGDVDGKTLERPLSTFADAIESNLKGEHAWVSWSKLFTGRDPVPRELHRLVMIKPALDYSRLAPGAKASEAVRDTARVLAIVPEHGAAVKLTGDVALADEEFASVERGTGLATGLSVAVVLFILYGAIRDPKPIFAIFITLFVGLATTFAFAAWAVQKLNLISVAFVVMFIGIAVDFSIQFTVRYRDEHARLESADWAAVQTGFNVGGPLLLAAVTTAIGFLAFSPTAYRGVSELGLIAGVGMLIALVLNLSLLPAFFRLLNLKPARERPQFLRSPAADNFLVDNRRAIIGVALTLAVIAAALLPRLSFDADPINLKDPGTESVKTLRLLVADGTASPNTLSVFVPSAADLPAMTAKLDAVAEVDRTVSLASFVPKDQEQKLAMIADVALILSPALDAKAKTALPSDAETLATLRETIGRLKTTKTGDAGVKQTFDRLAALLTTAIEGAAPKLDMLREALLRGLPERLAALSDLLKASPVTLDSLPPEIKQEWVTPDGRYRIRVFPKGDTTNNETLSKFVSAVRAAVPDATGPAYFIEKSGGVVWGAFKGAFLYALGGVVFILLVVLRRVRDVALVVGPLLFSTIMTLGSCVIFGIPLNFANVIALPLLLGIGVAFNIYFVMNWRAGRRNPLQSSTARAVVFSAFTTLTAFSSLAFSPHAGTASMGRLLTICLLYTLASALILVPALLGTPEARERAR